MKNKYFNSLSGKDVQIERVTVRIEDKIAEGKLSVVYNCSDVRGKKYALKIFGADDVNVFHALLNHVELHKKVSNDPHITSVLGLVVNPLSKTAFELMELCDGNLKSFMNERESGKFDDKEIVSIFQDVCTGVHAMHRSVPMIVHQNIKCQNILHARGQWKLCDFQLACMPAQNTTNELIAAQRIIEQYSMDRVLTPEHFRADAQFQISPSVDIWALGCVLFELCTFRKPFHDENKTRKAKYHWPKNRDVDIRFKEIVSLCLQPEPHKRPRISELLGELYNRFPEWVDQRWKPTHRTPAKPLQAFLLMQSQEISTLEMPKNLTRNPGRIESSSVKPQQSNAPMYRKFTINSFNQNRVGLYNVHCDVNEKKSDDKEENDKNNESKNNSEHNNSNNEMELAAVPRRRNYPNPQQSMHVLKNLSSPTLLSSSQSNQLTISSLLSNHRQENPNESSPKPVPVPDKKTPSKQNEENDIILMQRMDSDRINLSVELLSMTENEMKNIISKMRSIGPNKLDHFSFRLLHCSGTRPAYVIQAIHELQNEHANKVWSSRVHIHQHFPMIEGNFSIDTMKAQSKEKPLTIGDPPVCISFAVMLQKHLQRVIKLIGIDKANEYIDEAVFAYQFLTYVIGKLKLAKMEEEKLNNEIIPRLNHQFDRMIKFVNKPNFPKHPYNFDDKNQIKNIHSPAQFKHRK